MKIFHDGKYHTGENLPFETEEEGWSIYRAEDGSRLKMRVVVTDIIRLNTYKDDGEPMYVIRSTNVISVGDVPEELMKPEDSS